MFHIILIILSHEIFSDLANYVISQLTNYLTIKLSEIIFLLDITDTGVQSRTVYDVQNERYLTYKKGGKKGLKVEKSGKVCKSWSAVKGIYWNSKTSKNLGKLVVSVNRFFQTDLSVLIV